MLENLKISPTEPYSEEEETINIIILLAKKPHH